MASKLFEPAALFITFREAVEAGVIISVSLAFLRKTNMMHLKPQGAPSRAECPQPATSSAAPGRRTAPRALPARALRSVAVPGRPRAGCARRGPPPQRPAVRG